MSRRNQRRKKERRELRRSRAYEPDVEAWRRTTNATLLRPDQWRTMAVEFHVVGVMGYAGRWRGIEGDSAQCRKDDARAMLRLELQKRQAQHGERLCMVSGATNAGVLGLAYAECVALGIANAGVTAEQALTLGLAPLRWVIPGGRRFGDESPLFVETADELIVLGGGPQSRAEARMAAALGRPITVLRGFGGIADALTRDEVPTATFIERTRSSSCFEPSAC